MEKDKSYRSIAFAPNLNSYHAASRGGGFGRTVNRTKKFLVKDFGKIDAKTSAWRNASEERATRQETATPGCFERMQGPRGDRHWLQKRLRQ
ncbi:MAG: hypothetical protein ACREC4_11210 [Methylocella sp.]